MELGLKGKVAVVTGASRGIGLAIAEGFAEEGAKVVAVSRGGSDGLKELSERHSVVAVEADLSEPEGPREGISAAVEEFGGVDVLVNNVGAFEARTEGFDAIPDEDWRRSFEINFMSAVRASRAALPQLVGRQGAIVNISSVNSRLPQSPVADYAPSKAALTNFSKLLAEELGPQGVRVNTVSPGPTRTSAWEDEGGFGAGLSGATSEDEISEFLDEFPEMAGITRGKMTEAEEVASVVLFLASEKASAVVGSDFTVDGGSLKAI